jgi:hypothetical protein
MVVHLPVVTGVCGVQRKSQDGQSRFVPSFKDRKTRIRLRWAPTVTVREGKARGREGGAQTYTGSRRKSARRQRSTPRLLTFLPR